MTDTLIVLLAATVWFYGWRWRAHQLAEDGIRPVRVAKAMSFVGPIGAAAVDPYAAVLAVMLITGIALVVRGARPTGSLDDEWPPEFDEQGREVLTYSFGGYDHFDDTIHSVKYGITAREIKVRLAEHAADNRSLRWRVLAYGPGGESREDDIFARLDQWRYDSSEMFKATPDVVAAIADFETITREGRKALKQLEVAA